MTTDHNFGMHTFKQMSLIYLVIDQHMYTVIIDQHMYTVINISLFLVNTETLSHNVGLMPAQH